MGGDFDPGVAGKYQFVVVAIVACGVFAAGVMTIMYRRRRQRLYLEQMGMATWRGNTRLLMTDNGVLIEVPTRRTNNAGGTAGGERKKRRKLGPEPKLWDVEVGECVDESDDEASFESIESEDAKSKGKAVGRLDVDEWQVSSSVPHFSTRKLSSTSLRLFVAALRRDTPSPAVGSRWHSTNEAAWNFCRPLQTLSPLSTLLRQFKHATPLPASAHTQPVSIILPPHTSHDPLDPSAVPDQDPNADVTLLIAMPDRSLSCPPDDGDLPLLHLPSSACPRDADDFEAGGYAFPALQLGTANLNVNADWAELDALKPPKPPKAPRQPRQRRAPERPVDRLARSLFRPRVG